MIPDAVFFILFFIVALLYASVGHGGASGYIAIMALLQISPPTIRSTALILNVVASGIAFLQFYRNHKMPFSIFIPLILVSIPSAYIGAKIPAEGKAYTLALGFTLLFAAWRLLLPALKKTGFSDYQIIPVPLAKLIIAGAGIGLLSGWLGIGGGILLSPLLILMRWSTVYQTACMSAAFILVNSLSGLMALGDNLSALHENTGMLALLVSAGGILGSYMGSVTFNKKVVRYVLTTVLSLSALRLIFGG